MGIKKAIGVAGYCLFAERLKDRFVAGVTLQDAVNKAKFFRARGERSVINILGEHAKDPKEADRICRQIIELIILLHKEGLTDVNVAEKPTQIGLDISEYLYVRNKVKILEAAVIYLPQGFVETDAEDHFYRYSVFQAALELSERFPNQILACQINRRETVEEIQKLQNAGIGVRICKGNAYKGEIEGEKELRKIYLDITSKALLGSQKMAFATHDLFLIDRIAQVFAQDKDKLEFNLLMGIEENLCREKRLQGLALRRYIPCGPNWRPYGKRRAEAIVGIWLRNFFYRIGRRREYGRNNKPG